MLFVLKCLIVLGVLFLAIGAREGAVDPPRREAARPAARSKPPAETAATAIGAARATIADVADRAAGRVAEAARDHCLAHPLECLRAAEALQTAKPETARR